MIPEKIEQFLITLPEPDFFIEKNRAVTDEIHNLLRRYIEQGTETLEVNVDIELLARAETVLRSYGWTAEEAMVLFTMWCIVCPEKLGAWYAKAKEVEKT